MYEHLVYSNVFEKKQTFNDVSIYVQTFNIFKCFWIYANHKTDSIFVEYTVLHQSLQWEGGVERSLTWRQNPCICLERAVGGWGKCKRNIALFIETGGIFDKQWTVDLLNVSPHSILFDVLYVWTRMNSNINVWTHIWNCLNVLSIHY